MLRTAKPLGRDFIGSLHRQWAQNIPVSIAYRLCLFPADEDGIGIVDICDFLLYLERTLEEQSGL